MPTESELRRQFHDDEPQGTIDVDAVLRRSRARRRPRVVAVALASSLAVVGVVVPVSIGVAGTHSTTSVLRAGSAASEPDSGTSPQIANEGARTPVSALGLDRCGATLPAAGPAPDGLVLTVSPVEASATARDIPVTATLTNAGGTPVTGMISALPLLTLSRAGVVLWHNPADWQVGKKIDLSPGASMTFSMTFDPVVCSAEDDKSSSGFRDDLPMAGPGSYQLSAALDVTPATPNAEGLIAAVLVTGPTSPVTLH